MLPDVSYSVAVTASMLGQDIMDATVEKCEEYNATLGGVQCDEVKDVSPFSRAMRLNPEGVAYMYSSEVAGKGDSESAARVRDAWDANGRSGFDIISTFSPIGWPHTTDPLTQGGNNHQQWQNCTSGGATAVCFTAGCFKNEAYNGLPITCYCPVYVTDTWFKIPAGEGYSCSGQSVDGELAYVQNSCGPSCVPDFTPFIYGR